MKAAECIECGEEFRQRSVNHQRCGRCATRANPGSYQCPYRYCLEWHVPDPRKPHQHRRLTPEQSERTLASVPDFTLRRNG